MSGDEIPLKCTIVQDAIEGHFDARAIEQKESPLTVLSIKVIQEDVVEIYGGGNMQLCTLFNPSTFK